MNRSVATAPYHRAVAGADTIDVEDSEETRRTQILDAAVECFVQLGIARTSVQDVARMAKVSRGTVYRYFDDRNVLIEAAVEHGAQHFLREAAAAMAKKSTLAEQVGALGEVLARTLVEHRTRNRLMGDDAALMRQMIVGGKGAARGTAHFLVPYVEAAKERGEVATDLDVTAACEWLSRMINSISTVQGSSVFDMRKPRSVGEFLEQFAVAGLR
jgi:AcrR family transcriptional regulator